MNGVSYMEHLACLHLCIVDDTGAPLFARCYVWTSERKPTVGESYAADGRCPGVFFGNEIQVLIPKGVLVFIEVSHGFAWSIWRQSLQTSEDELHVTVTLTKAWEQREWLSGESHSHICRGEGNALHYGSFDWVRTLCRADGLDYYQPGYPWPNMSYTADGRVDLPRLEERLSKLSDAALLLAPGCEFPKGRFGHLCWVNLREIKLLSEECFDAAWENWLFNSHPHDTPKEYPYTLLPYSQIIAKHRHDQTFCFLAHPTSWWWHQGKFVTNIAAELPYLTMAGPLYDGIVVMGYKADHLYYQNIWFHLLNMGYRITGVAEVDAVWGRTSFDLPGKYRNYTYGTRRTMKDVAIGMRQGRNVVSSGPFILFTANGRYLPGDVCPEGKYELIIECWASGDEKERLSLVILFRNGRPSRLWDLRIRHVRHFKERVLIEEGHPAWYLVKCYGAVAPDQRTLDLMNFLPDHPGYEQDHVGQVALSNPIYFRPAGYQGPDVFTAQVRGIVTDQDDRRLNGHAKIEDPISNKCEVVGFCSGQFHLDLPLTATVEVQVEGFLSQQRSVRFDCPQITETIEAVYTGRFAKEGPWRPGQVLFRHLGWEQIERALADVTWHFRLEELPW